MGRAPMSAERKALRLRRRRMEVGRSREILRMQMRADLIRVAQLVKRAAGAAPTWEEYQKHGQFATTRVCKVVTGERYRWQKAVEALGLRSAGSILKGATQDMVLRDLWRVAGLTDSPGRMPPLTFYEEHGRYAFETVVNRMGVEPGRNVWARVAKAAELLRAPRYRGYDFTDDDLVSEYRKLAAQMEMAPGGPGPSLSAFVASVGVQCVPDRFGTWNAFVERCGYTPRALGGAPGVRPHRAGYTACPPRKSGAKGRTTTLHLFRGGDTCIHCGASRNASRRVPVPQRVTATPRARAA